MVLQVTQQCNLRCSYCAYSGLYHNRQHNAQRMNFQIAQKAIDFFLARNSEVDQLRFGFYGGEPLLEFDLIQKCVAYIRNAVEGKRVSFGLTTNGTLLTDEKIKFFVENDFQLMISLDGSKQEHDACRVFPNGQGSFDVVMQNLKRVKELFPDYASRIKISTVISPKADLNHTLEYFKSDEVLSDKHIIMNPLADTGLKERVDYKESFYLVRRYEYFKYLLYVLGRMDREYVSELVIRSQQETERFFRALQMHARLPRCTSPGGPCIPGVKKLFVMTDGRFYPCEKVAENNSCSQIGSLDEGFNLASMESLLNVGAISFEKCKDCWAFSFCRICAAQIESQDGQQQFREEDKLTACQKAKRNAAANLYEACVLHEFGYRSNEEAFIL